MGGIDDSALQEYAAYFSACNDAHTIRIEATPHYLQFADKIATLIHNTLPNVKLIFILREPASRLFTGYRNLRELESNTYGSWTFDQFVKQAIGFHESADHYAHDPRQRAAHYMHTGCYSKYLTTYLRVFDSSQICILFFDMLISSPQNFTTQAARFLQIDDSFYNSYGFSQENRTRTFRSRTMHRLAFRVNQVFEPALNRYPALRRSLRNIYNQFNEAKSNKETPSAESMELLYDLYRPHNLELRNLLHQYGYTDNMPAWLASESDLDASNS